jgi:predicted phage tail protein
MERAAYLFGKVTSATGQPLEGVAVNLYRRTGSGVFQGTSTSGPNGWYAFFGLVPGSFVAFTSNSLGYVNEIHDNVVCASTCSAATAVSTGTPIEVPDPTSILGFAAVNFALDLRNAAPGAPTNLRAVATGTGVEFSWTPPTSSTTGVAATYVIEAGAAPGATLVTLQAGTATRYTVPAVPPGVFYIRVRAQNAAGLGPVSNEVTLPMSASGAAPDAPINPQAFTNGNLLTFTWAPATTGGAPTGYVVEAGSSSGAANLATMPVSAPFFTYSPVPDGFYFLRVRATNAGGVSAPSAEQMIVVGNVTAPTSPPSFNSSPVSGSTVTLNWSAPAIGTATSYLIEAGSAPGLSNLASANTGNANTTISFSGVPRGTYYVRIRAVNAAGASLPSNERTITVQ